MFSYEYHRVPPERIDLENRITDFSLSPVPDALRRSIREIGVTHPIFAVPSGKRLQVIAGHRRVNAAIELEMPLIPAYLVTNGEAIPHEQRIRFNLTENASHRDYSDAEKGLIINRLASIGAGEAAIVSQYMPILGLERSKKLFLDYRTMEALSPGLIQLIHDGRIPLRIFSALCGWDEPGRKAAERMLSVLRPGANKWRDLLELVDETARRDEKSHSDILSREEVQSALDQPDSPHQEKYQRIARLLHSWRYPALTELRSRVAKTIDRLDLAQGTKVRTQESFEEDQLKIEIRFRDQKQIADQAEKLSAAARSPAMADLIKIFRGMGG